jgi:SAM-dependent methyltransferase
MKEDNNFLELCIGSGFYSKKRIWLNNDEDYKNVIKLDINPKCNPDVVWDLEKHPLPFNDNMFDAIHAYDILEHLASQGDYKFFFNEWNEYYRILKPDGLFYGMVPSVKSPWAFGDPGHKRIIPIGMLLFLEKDKYERELGKTAMSDYREYLKCNFIIILKEDDDSSLLFILKAIK